MGWAEGFLAAAERRGLRAETLALYARLLERFRNHLKLDLETCGKGELLAALDGERATCSLRYYSLEVTMMKAALNFLGRKDLAQCQGVTSVMACDL